MSDERVWARLKGQMFGVAVWGAIAAGAWILSAAGAPKTIVAMFALLAVAGLVMFGVRSTKQR